MFFVASLQTQTPRVQLGHCFSTQVPLAAGLAHPLHVQTPVLTSHVPMPEHTWHQHTHGTHTEHTRNMHTHMEHTHTHTHTHTCTRTHTHTCVMVRLHNRRHSEQPCKHRGQTSSLRCLGLPR
jgi:hypothetical protein